uniref:Reverse transcriptase domain-containing protein n=1 Tax=Oryzias latipes TaxID=8090 RepID=A0A3B3HJX1_ORYLA
LNLFYARFDRENKDPIFPSLHSTDTPPVLSTHVVRCVLKNINTRKAAGPDGVLGRVLKDCAAELTDIFTTIFNLSLSTAWVPTSFKSATITPIPKQSKVTCLNDYRPVALTSIPAKCLEKLVIKHIKATIPPSLDTYQFAYKKNRSTEDAIAIVLHRLLEHLEHKNTYARLLFVDYSSAFNLIRPFKLRAKLHHLGLNTALCNWTTDFLTNRKQSVRVGKYTSSTVLINTGAPQGCVLSPLLYSLFTHDCCSSSSSNLIVKFADDTTVLGLINDNNETDYRKEVQHLVSWCNNNDLILNITKTKEIIVDFRRRSKNHQSLSIGTEMVERVTSFKFLGVTMTEDLSWGPHTASVVGKAQQRLYYLRKLKVAKISRQLMVNFYNCAISSVLTFDFLVWFHSCTKADQQRLQRVVKTAGKIIGTILPEMGSLYTTRCLKRVQNILHDQHHPAHHLFHLLPSGRRYRSIKAKTTRLSNSLYPQAVRLLNSPS